MLMFSNLSKLSSLVKADGKRPSPTTASTMVAKPQLQLSITVDQIVKAPSQFDQLPTKASSGLSAGSAPVTSSTKSRDHTKNTDHQVAKKLFRNFESMTGEDTLYATDDARRERVKESLLTF